jgi:hypothetical protein
MVLIGLVNEARITAIAVLNTVAIIHPCHRLYSIAAAMVHKRRDLNMRIKKFSSSRILSLMIVSICFISAVQAQDVLTRQGDQFFYDGRSFDMWGMRTASATKDDAATNHLIEQLDDYKAYNLNTVNPYYQGSSAAYYRAFSSDGTTIDAGHQSRMERIIKACQQRDMVVIVGIFYQRAPGLGSAEAYRNAVRAVTRVLKPYRNVIINIANEQNSGNYSDTANIFDIRDPQNIIDLCRLVHQEDPDRIVGGGGYDHPKNKIIGRSPHVDTLLFDTSKTHERTGALYDEFVAAGVKDKPIVNIEPFGAAASELGSGGVYNSSGKQAYYREVDDVIARKGLYYLIFPGVWVQANPMRFDLGGNGSSSNPGIRWFFEYVREKVGKTSPTPSPTSTPRPAPTTSPGDLTSTISLSKGWNLISIPLQPSDKSVEHVMSSIDGSYTALYAFDGTGYQSYIKGESDNGLGSVEPGRGYWIYMDESRTLSLTGKKASPSVEVSEGWNLVGYSSTTPIQIEQGLASLGSKVQAVYAFDAVENRYEEYIPGSSSELTSLDPGRGYWIFANQDGVWTIGGSVKPAPTATPTPGNPSSSRYRERDGFVVFEAENFIRNDGQAVITKDTLSRLVKLCDPAPCDFEGQLNVLRNIWDREVSNGGAIQMTQKGKAVTYQFTTTTPGEWVIALHFWAGHHKVNGIYFRMDGQPAVEESYRLFLSKLKANFQWFIVDKNRNGQQGGLPSTTYLADLKPGTHTFEIVSSGEACIVDKIVLMTKEQYDKLLPQMVKCNDPDPKYKCIPNWTTGPAETR